MTATSPGILTFFNKPEVRLTPFLISYGSKGLSGLSGKIHSFLIELVIFLIISEIPIAAKTQAAGAITSISLTITQAK